MTETELQQSERICAEATEGPWYGATAYVYGPPVVKGCSLSILMADCNTPALSPTQRVANANFTAEARTALPLALAEIRRLQAEIHEWEESDAAGKVFTEEIDRLQAELARWKKAVEGLTPSGSEFANDPEACAAHIRERTNWPQITLRWKERAERAEAEIQQLRLLDGEARGQSPEVTRE